MLIQNLGTVSAAYTAMKTAVVQRQTSTAVDEGSTADKVTLSSTAKALAASV